MGFRADMRAAGVAFLNDYAASAGVKLQVYPARPRSIQPPTAFVDVIRETLSTTGAGVGLQQITPQVEIVVLHGVFDSADTVAQADAFVDGFRAWTRTRFHQAGATTLAELVSIEDEPAYVPDWQPPEIQRTYFGSRITLEGYAENA